MSESYVESFLPELSVIMAPMAGAGGPVFRRIALEFGSAYVITPLTSAEGLIRDDASAWHLAKQFTYDAPRAVQIFGSNSQSMVKAAKRLEDTGERLIDLNFGCPARRIVGNSAGSAMLRDLKNLETVTRAVCKAVAIPVTAKIRLGWSRASINVLETVHILEDSGVAAITIHARTKTDSPATPPSWEWIQKAVESVRIPIIGNGGIRSPDDAANLTNTTGCHAVMIGRAAVGRPWLIRQSWDVLHGKNPESDPSERQRLAIARRHVSLQKELDPREDDFPDTRGVVSAYIRGLPGARRMRPTIFATKSYDELLDVIDERCGIDE